MKKTSRVLKSVDTLTVPVPVNLVQEISNFLLNCRAKETMHMLLALRDIADKFNKANPGKDIPPPPDAA